MTLHDRKALLQQQLGDAVKTARTSRQQLEHAQTAAVQLQAQIALLDELIAETT